MMARHRAALLIVVLATVLALVSPADARDGHGIHGSATVDVKPGGSGTVTSGLASAVETDLDIVLGEGAISDRPVSGLMAFTLLQVKSTKRTAAV